MFQTPDDLSSGVFLFNSLFKGSNIGSDQIYLLQKN